MEQFFTDVRHRVKEALPTSVSSERNLAEKLAEYDSTIRKATVYLFTRPLEGRSDINNSFRHWSLIFEFEDSTIRYVEGNEHNDQLIAFFFKERPLKDGSFYELGLIETSPKILREIAVKNELNYTNYCFATNNCQNWVKQFAKQLGDNVILANLDNHWSLVEAHPLFAYTASSSGRSWKSSSK